jgi:hypothetical protein
MEEVDSLTGLFACGKHPAFIRCRSLGKFAIAPFNFGL